jgi:cell division protein FtsN
MVVALIQMILVGAIMAYLVSAFFKGEEIPSSSKTQKDQSGLS